MGHLRRQTLTSGLQRVYYWFMSTEQVIMVVLGIVSGVLALMTFFQNRLGKIFGVLRDDIQVLRDDMQGLKCGG